MRRNLLTSGGCRARTGCRARAQSRGGLLAAAALLERAARLTPDPARRAQRELSAAWRKRDGGALDAALALLAEVEAGPTDALRAAEAKHLRGQIAFDQRRATDAARLLVDAARRLEPLNADLARETYLDALVAAIWASGTDAPDATSAVAAAAPATTPGPRGAQAYRPHPQSNGRTVHGRPRSRGPNHRPRASRKCGASTPVPRT